MYLVHPEHPSSGPETPRFGNRHQALRWITFRAANGSLSERRAHQEIARVSRDPRRNGREASNNRKRLLTGLIDGRGTSSTRKCCTALRNRAACASVMRDRHEAQFGLACTL